MPSGRRSDIAEPSLALRGDAGGDVPAIVSGEPFFCLVEIVSNSSKSIRRSQKVQSHTKLNGRYSFFGRGVGRDAIDFRRRKSSHHAARHGKADAAARSLDFGSFAVGLHNGNQSLSM